MKFKYNEYTIDYPNDIFQDPLPLGVMYQYVSNTFLNGFINYGKIIKAFVIGRYHDWDEVIEEHKVYKTDKTTWTKNELYTYLLANPQFHTKNIDYNFQDDILILSQCKNNPKYYIMFWYDRDCSDCAILRFETEDSVEYVIEHFSEFVNKHNYNEFGEREIPTQFFKGWISS